MLESGGGGEDMYRMAERAAQATELRRIDALWKSNFEDRLDLVKQEVAALKGKLDEMSKAVNDLNSFLNMSKGAKGALMLLAQVIAASGIVAGGLWGIKKWILGL